MWFDKTPVFTSLACRNSSSKDVLLFSNYLTNYYERRHEEWFILLDCIYSEHNSDLCDLRASTHPSLDP